MIYASPRELDPTPPRPATALQAPPATLRMSVTVETAHLANPLVAAARLLASEANACARVTGDEHFFEVCVALGDGADAEHVEAWVRWAVHNAGVRGDIRRIE